MSSTSDQQLVNALFSAASTNTYKHREAVSAIAARLKENHEQKEKKKATIARLQTEKAKQREELLEANGKQREELLKIVDQLLDSDLKLESKDGVRIPCSKTLLSSASAHFASLLSPEMADGGVAEAVDGVVRLDASAAAVKLLVKHLHLPKADFEKAIKAADPPIKLEAMQLADLYGIGELLWLACRSLTQERQASPSVWCSALATASVHLNAPEQPELPFRKRSWQDARNVATDRIAGAYPASAACAEFGRLSLATVATIEKRWEHIFHSEKNGKLLMPPQRLALIGSSNMSSNSSDEEFAWTQPRPPSYVPPASKLVQPSFWYELHPVELQADDAALLQFMDPSRPAPPITATTTLTLPSGATEQVRLSLVRNSRSNGHTVKVDGSAVSMEGDNVIILCNGSEHLRSWQGKIDPSALPDGKLHIGGYVHLARDLCKLEVVRLWLRESGITREGEVLSPVETLQCLNALAQNLDVSQAPAEEVDARLSVAHRAAPGPSAPRTQAAQTDDPGGLDLASRRTALLDQLTREPRHEPSADELAKGVATYAARTFQRAESSGELLDLDARSLSLVLRDEELTAKGETSVMRTVVRWAMRPGREVAVADKVLPLVRFPLCARAIYPAMDGDVRSLWQRCKDSGSQVFSSLLLEATEMAMGKRHHCEMLSTFKNDAGEVLPRSKKRRCTKDDDQVPHFDMMSLLERSAGL